MSNTVLTFHDDGTPRSEQPLVRELAKVIGPDLPVGPYSLIWRAFTGKVQRWSYGLVKCTLSYDQDSKVFALALNNLVA